MTDFLRTLFCAIGRKIFSLRYKVEVRGLDQLNSRIQKGKGALFLPNHTAFLDPIMMSLWFWPKFHLRPLVVEYVNRMPIAKTLIHMAKGISIPNFETSINQYKIKKAENTFSRILEGVSNGDHFLIYPSGKVKKQPQEVIAGASGVYDILQKCPNVEIVLVRITGFYGSSFSTALSKHPPDPLRMVKKHFKTLLKNGIFFTPRRKIYIDLEIAPSDFPRTGTKLELNNYLENWYNQYRDDQGMIHKNEPLKLVSYSVWKSDLPTVEKTLESTAATKHISEETRTKVYAEIRKILDKTTLEIRPEMELGRDLGMDSLNIAELMSFLIQKYSAKTHSVGDLSSVQRVLEIAEEKEKIENAAPVQTVIEDEINRPPPFCPIGNTFPEAFLNACKRMGNHYAISDERAGNLSYNKCKKSVLVLAEYFRKIPEKQIAILLPSSAAAYITILALEFAGKVPVMLNWTLGPRYLEQMMEISGAKTIISSWAFLEKLNFVDFGTTADKIVFLEDIKSKLTLRMKLKGLFFPSKIRLDEKDPAVILFTSGTEGKPKGVPLSHKNILSSMPSAFKILSKTMSSNSGWHAFLPPFHSFGFSCSGFFPLFSGVRIACSPDPTDSQALKNAIKKWKLSHICIVPTFLRRLIHAATGDELDSLKLIVIGGEKAVPELYDLVANHLKKAKLIQGYGITECAPVVSIQDADLEPVGVGQLLSHLEVLTIHPETQEPLIRGAEGEICIHGDSVFSGYLGDVKSPFIQIEGKSWYRTGDLCYLTPDNSVIFSGRLKRFIKLGGEMISLGAIEEALHNHLLEKGHIPPEPPSIAVCAEESNAEKPRLIVFSSVALETDTANEILNQSGFSRLVKISSVQRINEIPISSTGKTNYRKLLTST